MKITDDEATLLVKLRESGKLSSLSLNYREKINAEKLVECGYVKYVRGDGGPSPFGVSHSLEITASGLNAISSKDS